MKKNDVAKMRQAGTAPATGTTICCPTSPWCAVTHKHCSVMDTTNTLLRANVRLVLRSDLCRIYCANYGCVWNIWNLEFGSNRRSASLYRCAFGVAECEVRVHRSQRIEIRCHLDECGAACALKSGSTEGSQACVS